MRIDHFMDELASQLGAGLVLLTELHAWLLHFDEEVSIELTYLEGEHRLRLLTCLGTFYPSTGAELMSGLLMANLYFTENGSAHFSIEPSSARVILRQTLPLEQVDVATVRRELDRLAEACRQLRQRFSEMSFIST